jgi:5'-AMP-activated protein kinase catalytic alpha subunit
MTAPSAGAVVNGKYSLRTHLGTSAFSSIWLAEHILLDFPVILKIIPKSQLASDASATRLIREFNLLHQMDHAFIAKTYEIFDDDDAQYLVMEFACGGTLAEVVAANGPMSESHARTLFLQLVYALEYLHQTSCVPHRALCAENVMLDKHGNIRLINFGLAGAVQGHAPVTAYSPPAVAAGGRYNFSADVWAAGVLLFFLVTGAVPFQADNEADLVKRITEDSPDFPPTMSRSLHDLLSKMLHKLREERITLPRIKDHPWFSSTDFVILKQIAERHHEAMDGEVVARLAKCGYDTKWLTADTLSRRDSDLSVIYQMVMRERSTDLVYERMQRPGVAEPLERPAMGPSRSQATTRMSARPPPLPGPRRIVTPKAREEAPRTRTKSTVQPRVRASHSAVAAGGRFG